MDIVDFGHCSMNYHPARRCNGEQRHENLPLVEPSPETFYQHQRGGQRGSHLLPPTEKVDEVLAGLPSSNLVGVVENYAGNDHGAVARLAGDSILLHPAHPACPSPTKHWMRHFGHVMTHPGN